MALFNKKMSLEEILKAIEGLSEEEKAQVKAKMNESTEVPEEPQAEAQSDATEEKSNEPMVEEPSEQVEGEETENLEGEEVEEPTQEVEKAPETAPQTEELNDAEQENKKDVLGGLTDRVQALEEKLAELDELKELKELMEQFTQKQADSFGYKGAVPGGKKDIHEMSANELKQKLINGEI